MDAGRLFENKTAAGIARTFLVRSSSSKSANVLPATADGCWCWFCCWCWCCRSRILRTRSDRLSQPDSSPAFTIMSRSCWSTSPSRSASSLTASYRIRSPIFRPSARYSTSSWSLVLAYRCELSRNDSCCIDAGNGTLSGSSAPFTCGRVPNVSVGSVGGNVHVH